MPASPWTALRPWQAWLAVLLALLLLAAVQPAQAQDVLPVPQLSGRVIDQTGTLSNSDMARLSDKLKTLEDDKGSQVVVLMVDSTAPEDIFSYSHRVADTWKIGRKDVGDGLLVVVAKNDRQMRIEVARALEGAVPDIAAGRIINDVMAPAFRRGDFAGGLDDAVDQLSARIRGEDLPAAVVRGGSTQAGGGRPLDLATLLILYLVAWPIAAGMAHQVFGRRLGPAVTGAGMGLLAFLITTSLLAGLFIGLISLIFAIYPNVFNVARGGRGGPWGGGGGFGGGGFGGGGFGGGGFSSGGGGSFGGGGASGRW